MIMNQVTRIKRSNVLSRKEMLLRLLWRIRMDGMRGMSLMSVGGYLGIESFLQILFGRLEVYCDEP